MDHMGTRHGLRHHARTILLACTLVAGLTLGGCSGTTEAPPPAVIEIPDGFPQPSYPADNQPTTDRIALGKRLFFDKQISRTGEVACGSCHLQENAFADPRQLSIGIEGRIGKRNAPSLANMLFNTSFFWDGGVPTLEQQAIGPIINPLEMDMTMGEVVTRVAADPTYVDMFKRAYNAEPTPGYVTKAIASFVRTLVSGHSRYDKYSFGDNTAMTAAELRGKDVFFGEKAECFHCHIGFNFTNNAFRNNGLYLDYADHGRQLITELSVDQGLFKVPTLRNIALTAPYMHDGSLATLEDVVDHYMSGGKGHPNRDVLIHKFTLTDEEKADLIAFMKSLTDDTFTSNPKFKP